MTTVWLAGFALAAALGAGPGSCPADESSVPSTATLETVEEHWPDGRLRLRKQVLLRSDGTRIDHGRFERRHPNGQREYEACFVHGRKEGTTVRYHRNGQVATEQRYLGGERHGPSVSWDANGAKVKEENWSEGRPHGTWTIWEQGRVKWRHTYDHGVPAP